VSPFVVAFAHHALSTIRTENGDILGLDGDELSTVRSMRQRAISCLQQFESAPSSPDAGTFGFWPLDSNSTERQSALETGLFAMLRGPVLGGNRAPVNLSYFPARLAIPSDADVTATTYAALLDHHDLDDGHEVNVAIETFFADWRDTGEHPLRYSPEWLPPQSGAFLTWLMYREPEAETFGNDLDLVVNANVLYALARYGKGATPGFEESVALINSAVTQGLHRTHWSEISLYYPDSYVFHYCVARAYAEGPVPQLAPAVEILSEELLGEAISGPLGTSYWNRGNPHLNTAFALLTLQLADADSPTVDAGIRYLKEQQCPITGSWKEAPFFIANSDSGVVIEWESAALTTAMALEALCRHQMRE